jgi:NitT/TauT family transport system substrate-binding protein
MLPTGYRRGWGAMGIRRVSSALLTTVVALVLAAGCSNSGNGPDAGRPEKPVLSVAVVPAVDSAGFFVALDQGLFKAQGLTVNFTPVTSSEDVIAS